MASDADYEGCKEDRCDNRFDQTQEDLAQDRQVLCEVGPVQADLNADQHTHQDPGGQRFLTNGEQDNEYEGEPAASDQEEVRKFKRRIEVKQMQDCRNRKKDKNDRNESFLIQVFESLGELFKNEPAI